MKIPTIAFLFLLLTGSQLFSLPVGAAALSYEPTVELRGTVVMEEHFGAPGFGEDPMTDSRDLLAFLILDEPVSVDGIPGDLINITRTDVRRIQLVSPYIRFSPYQSVHVVVSGELFGRHTGHHYADVLIQVESIAARR